MEYDSVTRLPNRRRFTADYQAAPGAQLVMVTLIGPNDYNQLLRGIGHDNADEFVRCAADRLQTVLGPSGQLYHVALLSFVFICGTAASEPLLRALTTAFEAPLVCAGIPIMATIAIGLAPCDSVDGALPLRAALTATQDCRTQGLSWAHYNPQSDRAQQRGFLILSSLSGALSAPGQLALNFQPKYDLASGRLTSAEALLRWHHPTLGSVSPADFIPLAENTTHIHALTDWVMDEALKQAASWRDAGAPIRIAINVSPRNLAQPGFARRTIARLAAHGLEGPSIELEFTEGLLVANDQVVLNELKQLRAAGIHIALDDFGTGFANFSYITNLPADIIKIDKYFIMRIGEDQRTAAVVQAIVDLAHRLGYGVVAEGIETEREYGMLAGWACDEGQGFLMSRPLDSEGFAALLARPANARGETVSLNNPGESPEHAAARAPTRQTAP
jgi:EAL domain-containing protein (putative c-di-GMP-specific phosphodiesterase class I)/GGDEF domain-containing protein